MKTKITTMGLVVFAVVQFFSFTPAQAELIIIAVEATVDTVDDQVGHLEGNISPGDTISGYYTYESTTATARGPLRAGKFSYLRLDSIFLIFTPTTYHIQNTLHTLALR